MRKKTLLASTAAMPELRPSQPQRPHTLLAEAARPAACAPEGAAQQRRQSQSAWRDTGGDEDAECDDDEKGDDGDPDLLVPDPQVCREFGVSAMTLWRWDRDPHLNFPVRITVRRRNFRSRKEIEKFKARLLRSAIARRWSEHRG